MCIYFYKFQLILFFFFFFSSRRRHTRFDCDWSSDVCSSDLGSWLGLVLFAPHRTLLKGDAPAWDTRTFNERGLLPREYSTTRRAWQPELATGGLCPCLRGNTCPGGPRDGTAPARIPAGRPQETLYAAVPRRPRGCPMFRGRRSWPPGGSATSRRGRSRCPARASPAPEPLEGRPVEKCSARAGCDNSRLQRQRDASPAPPRAAPGLALPRGCCRMYAGKRRRS